MSLTALVILFLPELVCIVAHGLVVRLGQELVVQHAVREHEPGWGWTVNIFPPQQIFSGRCVVCDLSRSCSQSLIWSVMVGGMVALTLELLSTCIWRNLASILVSQGCIFSLC